MYHGSFEVNHPRLKSGARTFKGTDGVERTLPDWPADADGVRVGYMEKAGKRFAAVRILDGTADVVLKNEVLLDTQVHLGRGKRFSADATAVANEPVIVLLNDAIRKNPDQAAELEAVKSRVTAG